VAHALLARGAFLVAAAAALLFVAVTASSVRAAAPTCVASARAGAATPGGGLGTAVTLNALCDGDGALSVALPGGERTELAVEDGVPLEAPVGDAYLCDGQAPLLRVESAAPLDYAAWLPLEGLGRLPVCDVLLKAGVTALRWAGPSLRVEDAFAPLAGVPPTERTVSTRALARAEAGVVPGLSVWAADLNSQWHWLGWGDGVPALLGGLSRLEPGREYLVVSDVARAWTFPEPSLPPSYFEGAQVVSFYGYPGVPVMGALGAYTPDRAAEEVAAWAEQYDRLNGARDVIPAFHLITAVAQRDPQADGSYLGRLDDDAIAAYVEAAREHGLLLFLDIQVGWSDPLAEVERLRPFLAEPFVHLALDPEFATASLGVAPGKLIGHLEAAQVNAVQDYLAELVVDEGLPPKILVLHQFMDFMLRDRDQYADVPEVELTIDMDGFGWDRDKLTKYEIYALQPAAERAAMKLFFDWDAPLLTPARLQGLGDPPDLIIYQ
jgi:hypothetical protein